MKFRHPNASFFVPDAVREEAALSRTTRLGIGAHPDDLEFMALHGIAACRAGAGEWFGGIVCTTGAASAAEERRRRDEQQKAAQIGRYSFVAQLGYSGQEVRSGSVALAQDLADMLAATKPRIVYTHALADKHDTHVAVAVATIAALRKQPPEERPVQVLGCEVWRSLDWLADHHKVVLDVGGARELAEALLNVFQSQIEGGKRYDRAVEGRKSANATFLDPHKPDVSAGAWLAMDLTPLVRDDSLDPVEYAMTFVDELRDDIATRIKRSLGCRRRGV